MRHGVIHLKPLFNQPAASEAAASAGVKSCSECWVQRVSWGCLVSPSSSQRRFGRGLRAWTQPVMPLSICALWELTPSWDLLPDGWCSHCKQLNITAEASATFSLSPAKKRGKRNWSKSTQNEALLRFYRARLLDKRVNFLAYPSTTCSRAELGSVFTNKCTHSWFISCLQSDLRLFPNTHPDGRRMPLWSGNLTGRDVCNPKPLAELSQSDGEPRCCWADSYCSWFMG